MAPRWRRTGAAVAVALYLCACLNSIIIQAIGLRGDPAGVAIVRRLVNGAAGSSGRRSAGAVAVGRSLAQQAPGPVVAKRLVATDGKADSWFGGSVAMSLDGLTLAVGAWADDVNGVEDQGSV